MFTIKKIGESLSKKIFLNKFFAYFLLLVFFIIFRDFIGIFILTFIFSYLFYSLSVFLEKKLNKLFSKNFKFLKKVFSLNFIIIFLYVFFVFGLIFIISDMIPKLVNELSALSKNLPFLSDYTTGFLDRLKELTTMNSELSENIKELLDSQDFTLFVDLLKRLKGFSIGFFKIILSLFLSFVFLLDRRRLYIYLEKIKDSNFKFLYKEYKIIFEKIVKSFGVVIKAQATIAFVNTILTAIGLTIIGLLNSNSGYPYFLTLILVVFIAGLIPVVGTFISSVPIVIVGYSAYSFRGISIVFELIILISVIHLIETYYLNPKIVSKAISVPLSITFVILLLSENLFGPTGLILGMSVFYFVVSLISDIDKSIVPKKNK